MTNIDEINEMGRTLIKKCEKLLYKSETIDFDILHVLEEKNASVSMKIHFQGPLKSEPNIYKALTIYFSKFSTAVFCSQKLYLLIWRRCLKTFFVFDPNGRNSSCERDFDKGVSALFTVQHIEHLVHLIINFSKEDINSDFSLYEIKLTSFGKLLERAPKQPFPRRIKRLWAVVNSQYAVIPSATSGLDQPINGVKQNPSMIISTFALLYADIDRPTLWEPLTLDDLIKFGTKHFQHLLKHPVKPANQNAESENETEKKTKSSKQLKITKQKAMAKLSKIQFNILDLPEKFTLGAYKAQLKKYPFQYTGQIYNCKSFLDSQLTFAMKQLFSGNAEAALLQVDNLTLAVWRDSDYFYVFDPFRRGRAGQVLDPEDFRSKGLAVLQLHTNFESLCRILYDKALKMRRGGKFFLHGIRVGCIRPSVHMMNLKIFKYPHLQLTYPKFVDDDDVNALRAPEETAAPAAEGEATAVAAAAAPAEAEATAADTGAETGEEAAEKPEIKKPKDKPQKPKKEGKPVLEKTYSIQDIPASERIPEYDEWDIVEVVLEEILCEIFKNLYEPIPQRVPLYKQAQRVLLGSDMAHLRDMKYRVDHHLDPELMEEYSTVPEPELQPISLEDELKIPSNFDILPDGAWAIFGKSQLPVIDEEMSKLGGLLSAIMTVVLTAKYNISTWNAELIEYALESCNSFDESFKNYEFTLSALLSNELPKIQVGSTTYEVKQQKVINSSAPRSLRQVLLEALTRYPRILIVCKNFSCSIIKRYNFLYMFIGFACTPVAYRKFGKGPACLLRFIELDALIRRIEFGCNPQGCELVNYIIIALKPVDISPQNQGRFRDMNKELKKKVYENEEARILEQKARRLIKLHFIKSQMGLEKKRIADFEKAKMEHEKRLADRAAARKAAKEARRQAWYEKKCKYKIVFILY